MTSLIEVLFWRYIWRYRGPYIPPIRFLRCICLFLSTYLHATPHLIWSPSNFLKPGGWLADWPFSSGMFHKAWAYVVLYILGVQNESKCRGCENCDAWNRFASPSENAGKPQTPTVVRILARLPIFALSRVSEICSSSKQVSKVRRMF